MKIMINLLGFSGFDSQSIYAANMVSAMFEVNKGNKFLILCNSEFKKGLKKTPNIQFISFNVGQSWFFRIILINFVLPITFFIKKCKLVYNPNVIFPIILARFSFVTIHDLAYIHSSEKEINFSSIFMRMMYFFAKHCKKVIAISFSVKDDLEKCGFNKKKIIVAYNALPLALNDIDTENSFNIPNGDYIVYVGMYRKRKNIENLIKSISYNKDIKLVLVGSVIGMKDDLILYAKSLGIEDQIIFSGKVSNIDKDKIIANSKLLVFPSFYEGFGFPILEAQNLGVPVCASDIPIFREVGAGSICYFNPRDPLDIYENIKSVLSDSKTILSLKEKGLENLKRFNWKSSAGVILNEFSI